MQSNIAKSFNEEEKIGAITPRKRERTKKHIYFFALVSGAEEWRGAGAAGAAYSASSLCRSD